MTMERAIETFARGYCFTRAFTHPYTAARAGPLWILRDRPRKSGNPRREEFISYGVEPKQVHQVVRRHARGHYCICAIHDPGEEGDLLRDGFKSLGYRLGHTEFMMTHSLKRIPRAPAPLPVCRVDSVEMAHRLAKAARSRQILPEHLAKDAPLRCYVALEGDAPVGWVSSVVTGDTTWCANMFVKPKYRRRGIARSLMCRLLRDDRAAGAHMAVLLASHVGANLYMAVGYREIGTLMVFTPKRK